MRLRHYFSFLCLLVGLMMAGPQPVAADCAGPTYSHAVGEFDHGDTLTVEGVFWGDDCYDTGSPPAGEGDIGLPIGNIEIVLVQGETELLVATGNADENYEFVVDVTIPSELEPGPFEIAARAGGSLGLGYNNTAATPTYSPTNESVVEVTEAVFGPSEPITSLAAGAANGTADDTAAEITATDSETESATGEADGDTSYGWILGITFAAAFGATVFLKRRR